MQHHKSKLIAAHLLTLGSLFLYRRYFKKKRSSFDVKQFEELINKIAAAEKSQLAKLQSTYNRILEDALIEISDKLLTSDPELNKSAVCGRDFKFQDTYYICEDCAMIKAQKKHPNSYEITKTVCCFCEKCFKGSDHQGHTFTQRKVEKNYDTGIGFCECGDTDVVRACCQEHRRPDPKYVSAHLLEKNVRTAFADIIKSMLYLVIRSMEEQVRAKMEKQEAAGKEESKAQKPDDDANREEENIQVLLNWILMSIAQMVKTNLVLANEISGVLAEQFAPDMILSHDCKNYQTALAFVADNSSPCTCSILECLMRLALYHHNQNREILYHTLKYLMIASQSFRVHYGVVCLRQINSLAFNKETLTADKNKVNVLIPSRYLRLVATCFGRMDLGLKIMQGLAPTAQAIEEFIWDCLATKFKWDEFFVYNTEMIEVLADIYYCIIENDDIVEQVIAPNHMHIRSILKLLLLIENLMPQAYSVQEYNQWLLHKGLSSLIYIKEVSMMLSQARQKVVKAIYEKKDESLALWLAKECYLVQFQICSDRCLALMQNNLEFNTMTMPFQELLLDQFMHSLQSDSIDAYPTRLSLIDFFKKYLDIEGYYEIERMLKLCIIYFESYIFFGLQELLIKSKKMQAISGSQLSSMYDFAIYSSTTPLRGEYDRQLLLRQMLFLLSGEHQPPLLLPFLHKIPEFIEYINAQPENKLVYQMTLAVHMQYLKRLFFDESAFANYVGLKGQKCKIHEDQLPLHQEAVRGLVKKIIINVLQILDQEAKLDEIIKNVAELLCDGDRHDQLIEEVTKECCQFDANNEVYRLKIEYDNHFYPFVVLRNQQYMSDKFEELRETSYKDVDPIFGTDFSCETKF